MTVVYVILILLLVGYSITASILLFNMVRREESMEEFYETKIQTIEEKLIATKLKVEETAEGLKQVDIRGSFEADDEVGFAFKEIKKLNEELLQYIMDYNKSTEDNA